ncbi:MAG: SpoIID/LytB domain-containing protein [Armatimonadota bacterium]
MRYITLCLLVLLTSSLISDASGETLRIGLVRQFKDVNEVTVSDAAGFTVSDKSGNVIAKMDTDEKVVLSAIDGKIQLTGAGDDLPSAGDIVEITSSASDSFLTLSSPRCKSANYRGKIEISLGKKGILLVNIVDLEDYIRGVLPSEMPSSFNIEALKAQAVAARTYAWANRGKHKKSNYDLCDSTHCQVYLGADGEKPSTSKAVTETEGLVIEREGHLISAQYSSDCGGITQDGGKPYLVSVSDSPEGGGADYCEHDEHCWTKSWDILEFEKLIAKSYPAIRGLKSVAVAESGSGNRVEKVELTADSGKIDMSGIQLRAILGNTAIKSTIFTVKVEDGKVVFNGRGFGHGIGLCQFGANGLAEAPNNYTFEQILKHYYRGVEIVRLSTTTEF